MFNDPPWFGNYCLWWLFDFREPIWLDRIELFADATPDWPLFLKFCSIWCCCCDVMFVLLKLLFEGVDWWLFRPTDYPYVISELGGAAFSYSFFCFYCCKAFKLVLICNVGYDPTYCCWCKDIWWLNYYSKSWGLSRILWLSGYSMLPSCDRLRFFIFSFFYWSSCFWANAASS